MSQADCKRQGLVQAWPYQRASEISGDGVFRGNRFLGVDDFRLVVARAVLQLLLVAIGLLQLVFVAIDASCGGDFRIYVIDCKNCVRETIIETIHKNKL